MPLYYLELHNDAEVTDDEGMELSDQAAAHAIALKSIAGILPDKIASGGRINLAHSLEVLDQDRRPVLLIPFRELIEE